MKKTSADAIKKVAGEIKAFEANNHNKLITKPTMPENKLMITKLEDLTIEKGLDLTIKKPTKSDMTIPGNYLVFASYSYPKINEQGDSYTKTLISPTVIYLNVTAKEATR